MTRQATVTSTAAWLLGSALFPITHADEPVKEPEPAKAVGPSIGDVLEASGITFTGYVDASYERLSGIGLFSSLTPDRVFDARHDSFTLNQAAITIAKQPKEGFGALVNLTAGEDAEVIKSYPHAGGSALDVTQAFVQYATGPLTVMGGKFVTLAGAEVINPTTDSNVSRSILFGNAIPFTHTGLRGTYGFNDQVSVTLGVNNGWDQVSDANKQKTVEFGLTLTPIKSLTLVVDGYVGKEPLGIVNNVPSTAEGQRLLIDTVATWNATDKFTVTANYDHGEQKDDSFGALKNTYRWDGAALYVNYLFTDQWSTSLRAEYFDDKDGYRTGVVNPASGAGQKWKEATLTLAYAPNKHALLRIEGRYDKSNVDGAFIRSMASAPDAFDVTDYQSSLALEGIYRF